MPTALLVPLLTALKPNEPMTCVAIKRFSSGVHCMTLLPSGARDLLERSASSGISGCSMGPQAVRLRQQLKTIAVSNINKNIFFIISFPYIGFFVRRAK